MARTNAGLAARLVLYYGVLVPTYREARIAWDTPGILDGITIYTPVLGEFISDIWLFNPAAWSGTTPRLTLYPAAAPDPFASNSFGVFDLLVTDFVEDGFRTPASSASDLRKAEGGAALNAILSDGSGGDPGSTSGEALIQFYSLIPLEVAA